MTLSRAALIGAIATTVAWTAKAVAIGAAGGDGRSPLEGSLFLLGLALCVLTSVLLGLAVTTHRGIVGKIIGVVVAAVVVTGFGAAENLVVNAVAPRHASWMWGEVNLWVLMVFQVVVAAVVVRGFRRAPTLAPLS